MEQLSAMGQLRRKYLALKGWTQAELAQAVGRGESTISFLMSERKDGERYLGKRRRKAGEVSLDSLVNAALEIPPEEVARAASEDAIRDAMEGYSMARLELASVNGSAQSSTRWFTAAGDIPPLAC